MNTPIMECKCESCELFMQDKRAMPCAAEVARLDAAILEALEACDNFPELASFDREAQRRRRRGRGIARHQSA